MKMYRDEKTQGLRRILFIELFADEGLKMQTSNFGK